MAKKLNIFVLTILIVVPMLAIALPAQVSANAFNPWGNDSVKNNAQSSIGLGNTDPREMAASIINVLLGFLGIIAVLIILFAGFKWMTAGGNEDGVAEAKKMLSAGVIGLIVILMAWALATYIIDVLIDVTT